MKLSIKNRKMPLIIGILIALFLIWLFLESLYSYSNGYLQRILPSEYIATAEALIKAPPSLPDFVYSVEPPPGTVISPDDRICIVINPEAIDMDDGDVIVNSRIYINTQEIPMIGSSDFDFDITSAEIASPEIWLKRVPTFCMTLDLPDGYHIFKIQLGKTVFDLLFPKAEYSYAWSYEVKSDTD